MNFQEGLSCGGAYIKLLSHSDKLKLVCINIVFGKIIKFITDV